ncbi:MAG: hypothetical protein KC729_00690 [Candidatus Eisenbacteria bacterium]|uniref:Glycosyltransferase RgtA/B/C/D-like domain-containing protein n=1 Tax=Eiseniibacteriota bacterium TaxID=2212470 RepID=A0A956LVL1_UNCEI|nr:hypothetical protein [Candidatus Eisenbacteria bacterium]
MSDDAFITFRYVDQWLSGHGLVYNPGERVEGYTHPLWLLLIAGLRPFGDPTHIAMGLGLIGYAGSIAILGLSFPLTAVILALHQEMAIWSTGGLETSWFTCAILLLTWTVARTQDPRRSALLSGLVSAAVVLARPDGAIFVAAAGTLLLVWARARGSHPFRIALLFGAPLVLVLGPYAIWKLTYYGDLLPNTYYAKSGGGAWWSQGFYYLWTYFQGHPTGLLGLGAWLLLPSALRQPRDQDSRTLVAAACFSVAYLLVFVARVGGDFMYARFVVPVVPLLYLSAEIGLRRWVLRPVVRRIAFAAIPILVLLEGPVLRDPLFIDSTQAEEHRRLHGIEDERWYWHHEIANGENRIDRYRKAGLGLRPMLEGLDVTVAIAGQASLAYYGRFDRVVEEAGLTEPSIAHRTVHERTRPGHEKEATLDQLRDLEVDLRLLHGELRDEPYRMIWFDLGGYRVSGELLTYDPGFLARLFERNGERIQAMSFPDYFDYWAQEIAPVLPRAELQKSAERMDAYYFRRNDDPSRQATLRALLPGASDVPR